MSSSYVTEAKKFFSTDVRNPNGIKKACHSGKVHSVAWNSTGTKLASGSADKTAAIYSVRDKLHKEIELTGHNDSVDQICWNPVNENLLATASGDKTVRIWDARSGNKAVKVLQTKGENINITWSPDGKTIACGDKDDVISFIDTKKWSISKQKSFEIEINEIKWNHAGDQFLLTTGNGTLNVLEYPTLKEAVPPIPAHTANCICIEYDPKGKYFATGSADALTNIWHASELVCLRTIAHTEWPIRGLSFSFDGLLLAAASEDPFINLTFVETGEVVHRIESPDGTFTVAWHPMRLLLAFAGDEKDPSSSRDAGLISLFGV